MSRASESGTVRLFVASGSTAAEPYIEPIREGPVVPDAAEHPAGPSQVSAREERGRELREHDGIDQRALAPMHSAPELEIRSNSARAELRRLVHRRRVEHRGQGGGEDTAPAAD